jgi:hypothetical protein
MTAARPGESSAKPTQSRRWPGSGTSRARIRCESAIARASTTLNINQQVGASIGTAVLSVLLTHELASRLPGGGSGSGIGTSLPDAVREQIAPQMAAAFGATFWYALALVGVAFVVAVALLPKSKPEPVEDPAAEAGVIAEPVLVGS